MGVDHLGAFEARFATGQAGESTVSQYLLGRGFMLLQAHQVLGTGAPAIQTADGDIAIPDFLAFQPGDSGAWDRGAGGAVWVEVKHKPSALSWHRISKRWVAGVDLGMYSNYLRLLKISPWPIWLLFVVDPHPDAEGSPTGLMGNDLRYLSERENHRSDRHGSTGMVFFAAEHLRPLLPTSAEVL